MTTDLVTHNDRLLSHYSPYAVATARNRPMLDDAPFGLQTRWHVDPMKRASGTFMDLLQRLDALTFGPEGMPMDKWVFYDCSELPGFIWGLAVDVSDLTPSEREMFRVPAGYAGPVPFSMYIAIPMHEPRTWFGHNLASLNRTFPHRGLQYLGTMTKAIALKAFRVEHFVGATQWTSKALHVHTKFGPLDLQTTYTPAHSLPETLTYAFEVTDEALRHAAGDPAYEMAYPEPDFWLEAEDVEAMKTLQAEIQGGARFTLVGPPQHTQGDDGQPITRHPLVRNA